MKITREEFKELVALYKDIESKAEKYSEVIQDKVVEDLAYPYLTWIIDKLDLEYDMFYELYDSGEVVIDCDFTEDGIPINRVYSSDLDEIYDAYLNNEL